MQDKKPHIAYKKGIELLNVAHAKASWWSTKPYLIDLVEKRFVGGIGECPRMFSISTCRRDKSLMSSTITPSFVFHMKIILLYLA